MHQVVGRILRWGGRVSSAVRELQGPAVPEANSATPARDILDEQSPNRPRCTARRQHQTGAIMLSRICRCCPRTAMGGKVTRGQKGGPRVCTLGRSSLALQRAPVPTQGPVGGADMAPGRKNEKGTQAPGAFSNPSES